MIPTMILCAGLGTRMRPLTEWCAKPLVPVGDRPALAHILERVSGGRVVVNAHHQAEDLRDFIARRSDEIGLSEEVELLGTAGGVARAAPLLGSGDVLIWNGDILAAIDAAALARAHASADVAATLAVAPRAKGEGTVGVDADGRVVRLRKESVRDGEVRGGEFLGVHVFGERLRAALPERGCLVGDVYLPAMRAGAVVGVHWFDGAWWDIGTLESYRAACFGWLAPRAKWVAAGARVDAGVSLDRCIVGAGASITGEGSVRDAIVWPGATLAAPARGVIATPRGVVRA